MQTEYEERRRDEEKINWEKWTLYMILAREREKKKERECELKSNFLGGKGQTEN